MSMTTPWNLVLLGPPGVGKGTQAVRLAARLRVPHVSTGDMLREAESLDTDSGRRAREYMDKGLLVADAVMIGMVRERLGRIDVNPGFVLDGFPRTVAQAEALERIAPLRAVVALEAPNVELVRRLAGRLTCRICKTPYSRPDGVAQIRDQRCPKDAGELYQRDDDAEGAVQQRLLEYNGKTAPLIEYYQRKDILRCVDGMSDVDSVADRVLRALTV